PILRRSKPCKHRGKCRKHRRKGICQAYNRQGDSRRCTPASAWIESPTGQFAALRVHHRAETGGSPVSQRDPVRVADDICRRHCLDSTRLLQVLIEAPDRCGWLSPPLLSAIAGCLGLPRARVEGVAGFYSFLHTRPPGRYRVLCSDNVTDRMLGAPALMEALCGKLWVEPGKLSEDGLVSVEATS